MAESRGNRRTRYSAIFKHQVVLEAKESSNISAVAKSYGIAASLLYKWMAKAKAEGAFWHTKETVVQRGLAMQEIDRLRKQLAYTQHELGTVQQALQKTKGVTTEAEQRAARMAIENEKLRNELEEMQRKFTWDLKMKEKQIAEQKLDLFIQENVLKKQEEALREKICSMPVKG